MMSKAFFYLTGKTLQDVSEHNTSLENAVLSLV